jgi:hypothetical protein
MPYRIIDVILADAGVIEILRILEQVLRNAVTQRIPGPGRLSLRY